MSFEIFLFKFEAEDIVSVHGEDVHGVLTQHGINYQLDPTYAELSDGLSVEVYVAGFESNNVTEIALTTRGFSAQLVSLVHALMSAAQLTVILPDQPPIALVASESAARELPAGSFGQVHVSDSPEQLLSLILPVYRKWHDWASI